MSDDTRHDALMLAVGIGLLFAIYWLMRLAG